MSIQVSTLCHSCGVPLKETSVLLSVQVAEIVVMVDTEHECKETGFEMVKGEQG